MNAKVVIRLNVQAAAELERIARARNATPGELARVQLERFINRELAEAERTAAAHAAA